MVFFFAEEYCVSDSRGHGGRKLASEGDRSWELHLLLTKAVFVRRRKMAESERVEDWVSGPVQGREKSLAADSAVAEEKGCAQAVVFEVQGLPWDATLTSAPLVLPPCTRIAQPLLLPETSEVLRAMAKRIVSGSLQGSLQMSREKQRPVKASSQGRGVHTTDEHLDSGKTGRSQDDSTAREAEGEPLQFARPLAQDFQEAGTASTGSVASN